MTERQWWARCVACGWRKEAESMDDAFVKRGDHVCPPEEGEHDTHNKLG